MKVYGGLMPGREPGQSAKFAAPGERLELLGECSIEPPFGALPQIIETKRPRPRGIAPAAGAPLVSDTVTFDIDAWWVDLCAERDSDGTLRIFPAVRLQPGDDPTNLPGWVAAA